MTNESRRLYIAEIEQRDRVRDIWIWYGFEMVGGLTAAGLIAYLVIRSIGA